MDRNLSEFQRNLIVISQNCSKSWTEIVQELRAKHNKVVTKRGIQYLRKRYLETGSVVDKMRNGRPPIISPQCSRAIKRIYQRNRLLSVSSITSIIILIHCDIYPLVRCRKFWKSTDWISIQHLRSSFWH